MGKIIYNLQFTTQPKVTLICTNKCTQLYQLYNNVTKTTNCYMIQALGLVFILFMVPCIVNLYYNKPTRCRCSQSILFHCRVTLHVSGAFHAHHQEYIKL